MAKVKPALAGQPRRRRAQEAALAMIGDELLQAHLDSNGPAIQVRLAGAGWETRRRCILPDNQAQIAAQLKRLWSQFPLLVCCGGLGPTQDDVTRQAIAAMLRRPLFVHAQSLRAIQARFIRRGLAMPGVNRLQAMFPKGAVVLRNALGTAAGFWITVSGRHLIALPGPPAECLPMLEQEALPRLRALAAASGLAVRRAVIRTAMVPESQLQEMLAPALAKEKGVELSFLLDEPGEILVMLTARGDSSRELSRQVRRSQDAVCALLGERVVDPQGKPLAAVVGKILGSRKQTVAVAESCTGGLIAGRITSVPGSSLYFHGGVVAYSNKAKTRYLGVPASLLKRRGAVSAAVAGRMAANVRRQARADWGLAVSGIAGPGGATQAKPVGLVYAGLDGPGGAPATRCFTFPGDRDCIRRMSVTAVLDMLRTRLLTGR
ncbi:CinA family nicotinamide mononucleotide deamidase-related protein [candidate division FCPU426 bacterium]|nr:CinA family nicotinamide mononucleotide deamidase-related protein [candidate division FCPU426 bacterium]